MDGWWTWRLLLVMLGVSWLMWLAGLSRRYLPKNKNYYLEMYIPTLPESPAPFPAVTICSQVKFRNASYNFYPFSNDPEDKQMLSDASLVCDQHINIPSNKTTHPRFISHLKSVAAPFEEVLYSCTWHNQLVNCSDFFVEVLTDEGLCFTSNMISLNELYKKDVELGLENIKGKATQYWDMEDGYHSNKPDRDAYPKPGQHHGPREGLNIIMLTYIDSQDHLCRGPLQGFKVQLHSPAEIPVFEEGYMRVPINRELQVAVKPRVTHSRDIWHTPQVMRECYFHEEKHLQYFKMYTKRNCEMECLTNLTLETCGCAAFYMPRKDKSVEICGGGSKMCIIDATKKIKRDEATRNKCKCLPECSNVQYEVESTVNEFHWEKVIQAYQSKPLEFNFTGYAMSRASIYIKSMPYFEYSRTIDYIWRPPDGNSLNGDGILLLTALCFVLLSLLAYHVQQVTTPRTQIGEELLPRTS